MFKKQPQIIKAHYLPEMPVDLLSKIMTRIHNEQQIAVAKRHLVIWTVGLLGSLVALWPAIATLSKSLTETGFGQYFKLIFTDTGIIFAQWETYLLSLLENLPTFGLMEILGVILVVLFISRKIVRILDQISSHNNLNISYQSLK